MACRKRASRRRSPASDAGSAGSVRLIRSGAVAERPYREQRHVVAGVALAEHEFDHALAQHVEVISRRTGNLRELTEALLEADVAALHEPVGVEQQRRAWRKHGTRLAEHGGVGRSDRHRPATLEEVGPVRGEPERRWVSGDAVRPSPVSRSSTR